MLPGKWREQQRPRRDVKIGQVEEFSRQLASVADMDEVLATTLHACREVFSGTAVFVMLLDETGERLYTVASARLPGFGRRLGGAGWRGADRRGRGAEAAGPRDAYGPRAFVRARARTPRAATEAAGENESSGCRVCTTSRARSSTPMLAHRKLVGVLCLQSEVPGAFQAADECVVSILANQVAMAMASLPSVRDRAGGAAVGRAAHA